MDSQDSGKAVVGTGAAIAAGTALILSPAGLAIVAGAALIGILGFAMIKKFNNVTIEGKHKDSSISMKGNN